MSYTTIPIKTIVEVPSSAVVNSLATTASAAAVATVPSKTGTNWLVIALIAVLLLGAGYLYYTSTRPTSNEE